MFFKILYIHFVFFRVIVLHFYMLLLLQLLLSVIISMCIYNCSYCVKIYTSEGYTDNYLIFSSAFDVFTYSVAWSMWYGLYLFSNFYECLTHSHVYNWNLFSWLCTWFIPYIKATVYRILFVEKTWLMRQKRNKALCCDVPDLMSPLAVF